MKTNIPKKLELIDLIVYAKKEISQWEEFIKKAQKKLEKMNKKN